MRQVAVIGAVAAYLFLLSAWMFMPPNRLPDYMADLQPSLRIFFGIGKKVCP